MARSRLRNALSFSHLIGGASAGRSGRRAADDDDDLDDQENNAPPGADEGDQDDDDGNATPSGRRRARGEDDDDNPGDDNDGDNPSGRRAQGNQNDDDGNATPSGRRRARGDDGEDDEDDEEDQDDPQACAARSRERARCAAIFATKAAAGRPDLAAHLAFNTSLPRSQAIGLLRTAAAGSTRRGGALADAMATFGQQRVSASAPGMSARARIDDSWDAAARRAGVVRG